MKVILATLYIRNALILLNLSPSLSEKSRVIYLTEDCLHLEHAGNVLFELVLYSFVINWLCIVIIIPASFPFFLAIPTENSLSDFQRRFRFKNKVYLYQSLFPSWQYQRIFCLVYINFDIYELNVMEMTILVTP